MITSCALIGPDATVSHCKKCDKAPMLFDYGCSFIHRCQDCGRMGEPRPTIQESRVEWEDVNG